LSIFSTQNLHMFLLPPNKQSFKS